MSHHKLQRSDESETIDPQRLLERGHLVLHAISTEAHAARVEAKRAELQVALAEAQSGDILQLQNWLEAYQAGVSSIYGSEVTPLSPAELNIPVTNLATISKVSDASTCSEPELTRSAPSSQPSESDSILSWNQLLPHARQRLATRASSIDATPLEAPAEETQPDDESTPPDESLLEDFERPSNEPLEFEVLPELNLLADSQRELDKPYSLSGKRGLLVSAVFHTAILLSLMAISMRLPEQAASLGFESSSYEGTNDSIEVMQAIDVVAPELTPEMPADSSTSSASSLPSASALSSSTVSVTSASASASLSNIGTSANQAAAMTGPGKPSLSKVNASFFGAAAGGNSFCYVIDGSESMRGGPWESAKRELLRSLSTLKENQRFYVIFFNKEVHAIPRIGETEPSSTALYATTENLKHATEWIEALRIAPGAPPDKALEMAIELELDAIYFLADGATKRDVCEFLRTKNRTADFISGEQIRVPVHTIAFYSPEAGRKLMQRIANENKGQSVYVPDPRKK